MRADDLILFSQVVEMGSFSKVAEQNNLTNSVVSKRIARLEEEIGVQLLYRTTRKLTLTEAGKAILHGAKNVKQATQEAMDAVSGFGENVSGHIKMSVPSISGDLILADAVAEFCNMHPGLTVDMSLDNRFVDLVNDGFDLVIRTGYLEDSSLIARHILDSQWVVCASPSYIARNGKPLIPTDLVKHNCLQYAYQTTVTWVAVLPEICSWFCTCTTPVTVRANCSAWANCTGCNTVPPSLAVPRVNSIII